jgi:hypothetical protein
MKYLDENQVKNQNSAVPVVILMKNQALMQLTHAIHMCISNFLMDEMNQVAVFKGRSDTCCFLYGPVSRKLTYKTITLLTTRKKGGFNDENYRRLNGRNDQQRRRPIG